MTIEAPERQRALRIGDLPEIVSRNMTAKVLGRSVVWLWRRRSIPIYAPNADGSYARRQIELIVDVLSGVHEPEYAYKILKAERDAKRAQGAIAIANSQKRKNMHERAINEAEFDSFLAEFTAPINHSIA